MVITNRKSSSSSSSSSSKEVIRIEDEGRRRGRGRVNHEGFLITTRDSEIVEATQRQSGSYASSRGTGRGPSLRFTSRSGALMIEFLVAMALVMGALIPFAYSFAKEKRLARALYQHAVAMEIVDGELEVLAAGGWKALPNGTSEFSVRAFAATNLPPGRFLVTRGDKRIKLEWRPAVRQHGGSVVREVALP